MLPRCRVETTLRHEEPDLVPWGEHSIDYNIYEMTLGRESWVHSKIKETKGYWDGRRDEIVASYKRDIPDLVRALGMDIVTVGTNPPAGYHPEAFEKLDDVTYRDPWGNLLRVSSAT